MFCFLDIETSGFPDRKGWNFYDPKEIKRYNNSRLIEAAYIILYFKNNEMFIKKEFSSLIKPSGFKIENFEIHGITTEEAENKGVDMINFLEEFTTDLKDVEKVISYNANFDINILLSECYRQDEKYYNILKEKKVECAMLFGQKFMNVYKWPKLRELYYYLFGKEFIQSHRAMDDTRAMLECYCKMKNIKYINK